MPISLKSISGGGGTKLKSQTFLSSGNFTVPDGVETVWVTMCGGGGSGGAIDITFSNHVTASGGGAGYFVEKLPVNVTPGAVIPVVVGAGGASVTGINWGNSGGSSSFGSFVVSGGQGGGWASGTSVAVAVLGGKGGADAFVAVSNAGSSIDNAAVRSGINFPNGSTIFNGGTKSATGGAGGAFGPGGNGSETTAGSAAANSGAGGGGYVKVYDANPNSGAGGSGRVIVEWLE